MATTLTDNQTGQRKTIEEIFDSLDSIPPVAPATVQVSFLTDGLHTLASPAIPNVAQLMVLDLTSQLTQNFNAGGDPLTTGDGITGLTEGAVCEISTSISMDNIVAQTTVYVSLINALDTDIRYLRVQMVANKLDDNIRDTLNFNFIVTPEMATDGVRLAITGHRGSLGTKLFDVEHSIKQYN